RGRVAAPGAHAHPAVAQENAGLHVAAEHGDGPNGELVQVSRDRHGDLRSAASPRRATGGQNRTPLETCATGTANIWSSVTPHRTGPRTDRAHGTRVP